MSDSRRVPVSEILHDVEKLLLQAVSVRERMAALEVQAAKWQKDALDFAVESLGETAGRSAYELACRGLGISVADNDAQVKIAEPSPAPAPSSTAPMVVVKEDIVEPVPPASPALSLPEVGSLDGVDADDETSQLAAISAEPDPLEEETGSSVQTHDLVPASDPTRLVLYGVEIRRAKHAEAMEVIELARRTAAQNKKTNPYDGDRGRNAWRNSLFAAVLAELSLPGTDLSLETAAEVDVEEAPEQVETSSPTPAIESGFDPLDEDLHSDENASSPALEEEQKSPIPSRAVPFTRNPVQSKLEDAGVRAMPTTKPSFSNTPSETTPETDIHVPKPVVGRVFAHGQASPMPAGLKEALEKKDAQPKSAPVTPVRTLMSRPSFLKQ